MVKLLEPAVRDPRWCRPGREGWRRCQGVRRGKKQNQHNQDKRALDPGVSTRTCGWRFCLWGTESPPTAQLLNLDLLVWEIMASPQSEPWVNVEETAA
jgi:hypothetical protein